MAFMRAKIKVTEVIKYDNSESVKFTGVAKSSAYSEDGSDEDNTFAKFSPSVALQITIANPALIGKLMVGMVFYVDFEQTTSSH